MSVFKDNNEKEDNNKIETKVDDEMLKNIPTREKKASVCFGLSSVTDPNERMFKLMGLLYKPHPWHGVSIGVGAPSVVTAYVECVPGEGIKYEVDKSTGYLKVDRPHKYSSLCPTIYGFLPQTYCDKRVAKTCMEQTKTTGIIGDQDPLDICILSTRNITHGDLLVDCRPIGGLRMIDGGEADDKIIAVIKGDPVMSSWNDIQDISKSYMDLIRHYFLTYKQSPNDVGGASKQKVTIPQIYGREQAYQTIMDSQLDYKDKYKSLKGEFAKSIMGTLKVGLAQALLGQGQ